MAGESGGPPDKAALFQHQNQHAGGVFRFDSGNAHFFLHYIPELYGTDDIK